MSDHLFEIESAGPSASGKGGEEPVSGTAGQSVVLRVHLQPGAGRASVVGRHGGALHLRVAAPPVGGRANVATVTLLAELLGVSKDQIELVSGERSREKRFRLSGVAPEVVGRALDEAIEAAASPRPGRARNEHPRR